MRPFVSVIVPTLNRRDMVAAQVEALRSQTYPSSCFEVLVIDNGSTDGTEQWALQAGQTTPFRFRFLRNLSPFRVPAQSRNIGISESQGDILAFTDSDCIVSPGWLTAGVEALLNAPEAGLAQGKTLPWDDEGKPAVYKTVAVESMNACFETCNIFYRRSAIELVAGFHRDFIEEYSYPKYFGEDTDLAYRVIEGGYSTVFAPAALVWHRILPQSMRSWILDPLKAFSWPLLVRKHPRIRRDMLCGGVFLTRMTAFFDLALIGLIFGFAFTPWTLLLCMPFLVAKYHEDGKHLPFLMRLVRVVGGGIRATVVFMVLLSGSIYFRTLVL